MGSLTLRLGVPAHVAASPGSLAPLRRFHHSRTALVQCVRWHGSTPKGLVKHWRLRRFFASPAFPICLFRETRSIHFCDLCFLDSVVLSFVERAPEEGGYLDVQLPLQQVVGCARSVARLCRL